MSLGRQLILFRDPSELPRIQRLISKPHALPAVVASQRPDLQEIAKSLFGIDEICFIELSESLFVVSTEVVSLVTKINNWLGTLIREQDVMPKEVLHWPSNVEGGLLNQRVQDSLLLIRSYRHLIERYKITEIHAFSHADWIWEDMVFREVAQSSNDTRFIAHRGYRSLGNWISGLSAKLRPVGIAIYFIGNIVRQRSRNTATIPENAIAFQLFGSSAKHIANVVPLLSALNKRGHAAVAWCWTSSERFTRNSSLRQLVEIGLPGISMENSLKTRDILESMLFSLGCWWRSHRNRAPKLVYCGVVLNRILKPSFWHFFVAEVPQRFRFYKALERTWAAHPPRALKIWGGPESFEGKLSVVMRRNRRDPLIFHYWIGASMDWPYAAREYGIELFLAKGPYEAAVAAREYRLSKENVVVVGQPRISGHRGFAKTNHRKRSRAALGLPLEGSLFVGYDPNANLRGLQSAEEQFRAMTTLLRIASRHPQIILVIKPHPLYPIDHLTTIIGTPRNPNVYELSPTAPIEVVLNAIDVIITKYSALILESAIMSCPSISLLFDGEDRFKVYGDLPEFVHTPAELELLLDRLAANHDAFDAWRKDRLLRQKAILPDFLLQSDTDPAELSADAILRFVSEIHNH